MKLVQLPGTTIAVNPAWVTCVEDKPNAVTYKKEPWPHVVVRWCLGTQQSEACLVGVSFAEVVDLFNKEM